MFADRDGKPGFWSARTWVAALGIGLLLTVLGGVYVINGLRGSDARFERIDHTYQVIATSQELLSVLTDAETGQRGYIITGDRQFLEPYDSARQRISSVLDKLSQLAAIDPLQKARIDSLRRLSELKMAELDQTVTLAEGGNTAAATERVRGGVGKQYMDQIRAKVDEVTGAEEDLLVQRQRELNEARRSDLIATVTFVVIAALLVVFAVIITLFIRRSNVELERCVVERTRDLRIAHEERLGLTDKLTRTQEEERKRIGQDVHDQLGQMITGLRLNLRALADDDTPDERSKQIVTTLVEQADALDTEVSFLSWMLRPAILDDLGLVPALEALVEQWSRHFGVEGDFEAFGVEDDILTHDIEVRLFRIVQEALTNCAKHAGASNVSVVLEQKRGTLNLIIEDDGCGFDLDSLSSADKGTHGIGLGSMRDRASVLGAAFEIESAEGSGTTIYVRVPVRQKPAAAKA